MAVCRKVESVLHDISKDLAAVIHSECVKMTDESKTPPNSKLMKYSKELMLIF